jgi:hypothetical protein
MKKFTYDSRIFTIHIRQFFVFRVGFVGVLSEVGDRGAVSIPKDDRLIGCTEMMTKYMIVFHMANSPYGVGSDLHRTEDDAADNDYSKSNIIYSLER